MYSSCSNYVCHLTSLQVDPRVHCWVWGVSTPWWSGPACAGRCCKGTPLFLQTHRGSHLLWSSPENRESMCVTSATGRRLDWDISSQRQTRLPVRRSCWASSLCSWAGSIVCTEHCTHVRHSHCFHQKESRCRQTPAGCCRVKQLRGRHQHNHSCSASLIC